MIPVSVDGKSLLARVLSPHDTMAPPVPGRLVDAAVTLAEQAASAHFRGPDPYDALWYSWPRALAAGPRRRQVLIQLHARAPLDIRRLYRRRHPRTAKALGIFASVGARAHRLTGQQQPLEIALRALELLTGDRTAGPRAWGYPFDMQTRWSFYAAGSPNVVATTFAASGLWESADVLRRPDFSARATESARWALEELWVEPQGYFAYHPARPVNIHNANLLGAWLVHVGLAGDEAAADRVARAVDRTLAAQRPDGSWPYGEGDRLGWADSFHSGYVLTLLARLRSVDGRIDEALARGAQHYCGFFDPAGRARLWTDRPYPEDGHSAGTGLTTLATLLRRDVIERDLLERVAARTIAAGVKGGHAVHRRHRWWRTRVSYLRWCDAHVALGLVDAAAALRGEDDLAPPRRDDG
jgi:hypothetical protein